MNSSIKRLGEVSFPEFTGERVYMRKFSVAAGLPDDLRRWQRTVDQMLVGVDAPGPIYLMVDQGYVKAGGTLRRPGLHVDGYWDVKAADHGLPPHRPPTHNTRYGGSDTLLLASDVLGCVAYEGEYEGICGPGGEFEHLDRSGLKPIEMEPLVCWYGDASTMLHEAIPSRVSGPRTVVRLNVVNMRRSPSDLLTEVLTGA